VPLTLMMKRLVLTLFLIYSSGLLAKENETFVEPPPTNVQMVRLFDERAAHDISALPDLVDKEEKVSECMEAYIKKQSKSYSRNAQNNLYDLIHNFDKVASKIYGKKAEGDDIPIQDKVEALARLQCEAYYTLKILK
jgi:hypothetical protein